MGPPGVAPEGAAWDEATALVGALAQRLRVDLGGLSPSDKIQLISVVVGAWQTFQQRSHHLDTARRALQGLRMRKQAGGASSLRAFHRA